MSALSIQPTYPIFTDIDGQPLENGYVWIGAANLDPQTNPINVYWDAALTISATQPIRTLAGYPSRSGTPARLYVNSDYSIRVQNRNGSAVYSAPTATERYNDAVISSVNAEDVIYDPPFVGAVSTNVEAKLAQTVSVKDFGAVGNGIANDRAAIQAAFDASKSVFFPAGTYYVGQLASGATAIDLRGKGDNINILTQGFVELVCETTNDSETSFFLIRPTDNSSTSHFYCDPIRFRDTGFTSTFPYRGATGFLIQNGNSNWGNLRFIGIYGKDIWQAISVTNAGNTDITNNRVRGIFIDEIFVDGGIYGVNLAAQGDGVYIKKIVTNAVYRPLFVYNVTSVEAVVFARNNLSTSGAINIGWTSTATAPVTSAIKVRYVARQCSTALQHVLINIIGPSLGVIKGIDLDLDIEDVVSGNPAVDFVTYTMSGGFPTAATLANVVTDVVIRGRVADSTNVIKTDANYTTAGLITLLSTNILVDATVYNNFKFTTVRTFVPTWTGSVSNPVIGNGALAGEFFVANGICQVTIQMNAGSTTTFGSGSWSFALPVTCRSINSQMGSALALDAGTLYYVGTAFAGGTAMQVTFDQTGNQAQATVPFTWATGDTLQMTVSYPI
jgi:hypothetical protein